MKLRFEPGATVAPESGEYNTVKGQDLMKLRFEHLNL